MTTDVDATVRADVLACLRAAAGNVKDLGARLGVAWTEVSWALVQLQSAGVARFDRSARVWRAVA